MQPFRDVADAMQLADESLVRAAAALVTAAGVAPLLQWGPKSTQRFLQSLSMDAETIRLD